MRRRRGQVGRHINPANGHQSVAAQSLPQTIRVQQKPVMIYDTPEKDTMDPHATGGLGSPYGSGGSDGTGMGTAWNRYEDRLTGNPALTAHQIALDKARGFVRQQAPSQVDPTRVEEFVGGTEVQKMEVTRDQQVSHVQGVEVHGDPQQVANALLTAASLPPQQQVRDFERMRRSVKRNQGAMQPQQAAAFAQAMRRNPGMAESLSDTGFPGGARDGYEYVDESGMVIPMTRASRDPATRMMAELARKRVAQGRVAAYKPAARFHPAQSNYASSDGQLGYVPGTAPAADPNTAVAAGDAASLAAAPSTSMAARATSVQRSPSGAMAAQRSTSSMTRSVVRQQVVGEGAPPALTTLPAGAAPLTPADTMPPSPGTGSDDSSTYVDENGMPQYVQPPTVDQGKLGRQVGLGILVAIGATGLFMMST